MTADTRLDLDEIRLRTPLLAVVSERVQMKRSGRLWAGCCPFHGEKTPSFTVYDDHYHCFGCGAHGDVVDFLRRLHDLSFGEAIHHLTGKTVATAVVQRPSHPVDHQTATKRNTEIAWKIWSEAPAIKGTPGEAYFRFRGVSLPAAPVLRFHPACPMGSERRPAVVAIMRHPITNEFTGISRIFVQPDGRGKADVPAPKMTLGQLGVVRLAEPEGEGLGICEGIETGLGVQERIAWGPVWATCGTSGMSNFPVLPMTCLTIFADAGAPGFKAARECANRWHAAGAEVRRCFPPSGYSDWLDVALEVA